MNTPLYTLAWFFALITSIYLIFTFIGVRYMVAMFPEGWRWWMLPVQLLSLAFFAAVVLCHPFGRVT